MSRFQSPRTSARGTRAKAVVADTLLLRELKSNAIQTIGSYQLGRTIGEGTFGKVKLAIHRLTGQEVAVKIVDKTYAVTVHREVDTWRRLRHPYIAQLYELLTSETRIYMVMEYAAKGEMFDYMQQFPLNRVPEQEAKRLFVQMLSAIQYCHSKQCVHRDLKLENIMLDSDNNVKLIDFGFTREFDRDKLLDTYCGSMAYAAPEMLQGQKYIGPAADIWSLAVCLFTLVTGNLPFDEQQEAKTQAKILAGDHVPLPEDISSSCRDLLSGMLVVQPDKRWDLHRIIAHPWIRDAWLKDAVCMQYDVALVSPITPSQVGSEESVDGGSSSGIKVETGSLVRKRTSTSNQNGTSVSPTRTSIVAHPLVTALSALGFDGDAMTQALAEDECNEMTALFHLLIRRQTRGGALKEASPASGETTPQPGTLSPVHPWLDGVDMTSSGTTVVQLSPAMSQIRPALQSANDSPRGRSRAGSAPTSSMLRYQLRAAAAQLPTNGPPSPVQSHIPPTLTLLDAPVTSKLHIDTGHSAALAYDDELDDSSGTLTTPKRSQLTIAEDAEETEESQAPVIASVSSLNRKKSHNVGTVRDQLGKLRIGK